VHKQHHQEVWRLRFYISWSWQKMQVSFCFMLKYIQSALSLIGGWAILDREVKRKILSKDVCHAA
jgi:hypothetical protein